MAKLWTLYFSKYFIVFVQFFIVLYGQILKNNISIWSHCTEYWSTKSNIKLLQLYFLHQEGQKVEVRIQSSHRTLIYLVVDWSGPWTLLFTRSKLLNFRVMTAIQLETENLCLKQILEIKIYNVVVVKKPFWKKSRKPRFPQSWNSK